MTDSVDAGLEPPEEQPILWLGMWGFEPEQRAVLEGVLASAPGLPHWRACEFSEADAWWVDGRKVTVLPDGNLKVGAGLPTEKALILDPGATDRPLAFARPLVSPDFEPLCTFDMTSDPSMHAVLLQFETWMKPVRAQFVLGGEIVRRGAALRHNIYHLSHRGTLLAVLNFRTGNAGLSPTLHPADLRLAQWDRRPAAAGEVPHNFTQVSTSQLSWSYVRRTDRKLLRTAYRTDIIYYRRVPRVPLGWLSDAQLMLLRELSGAPATLATLRERTRLAQDDIEHALTCLYFAGSITTTKAKAARHMLDRDDSLPLASVSGDSTLDLPEITVPGLLEHKRQMLYEVEVRPARSA